MALTSAELKTLITTEYDTGDFTAEIDTLWDLWVQMVGAEDLYLRRRLLTFLQGRYRTRYNVVQGRDSRSAFQQFQAVSGMLKDVNELIAKAEELSGANVPVLHVAHFHPSHPHRRVLLVEDVTRLEEAWLVERGIGKSETGRVEVIIDPFCR